MILGDVTFDLSIGASPFVVTLNDASGLVPLSLPDALETYIVPNDGMSRQKQSPIPLADSVRRFRVAMSDDFQTDDSERQLQTVRAVLSAAPIEKKPAMQDEKPVVMAEKPVVMAEKPVVIAEKPVVIAEKPVVAEVSREVHEVPREDASLMDIATVVVEKPEAASNVSAGLVVVEKRRFVSVEASSEPKRPDMTPMPVVSPTPVAATAVLPEAKPVVAAEARTNTPVAAERPAVADAPREVSIGISREVASLVDSAAVVGPQRGVAPAGGENQASVSTVPAMPVGVERRLTSVEMPVDAKRPDVTSMSGTAVPVSAPEVKSVVTAEMQVETPVVLQVKPVAVVVYAPEPAPIAMPVPKPVGAMPVSEPVVSEPFFAEHVEAPTEKTVVDVKVGLGFEKPIAVNVRPIVERESIVDDVEGIAPAALQAAPVAVASPVVLPAAPIAHEVAAASAAAARTEVIVETVDKIVEAVAEQIVVEPALSQGGDGNIRILLKPAVLDGSEILMTAKDGALTVAIVPATPESEHLAAVALPRLETALAEHVSAFRHVAVAIVQKKGKSNETA